MTWRLTSTDADPRLVAFRLERLGRGREAGHVQTRAGAERAGDATTRPEPLSGEISGRESSDTSQHAEHAGTTREPRARRLVMDILVANGPISANALQRKAKRRRSDVLAAVRALEREGLVRRNPDDRLEASA